MSITSRVSVCLSVLAVAGLGVCGVANAAPAQSYTAGKAVKLNVLGEWAHPDDDTSIIGPCGVWHDRYGTRCGIIMVTRGEGGGNAAGTEGGPSLGLRRENEDRAAHYRSGTVDIFNLDRVDFFYNLSAPLTQKFWSHDEVLRRVVRIIRLTQPDIYIGFGSSLAVGHGNHQQAGRFIWEGMKAAADPTQFPEQLTGPHALSTWQVKKVLSGGTTTSAAGSGGSTQSPDCNTGFVPATTGTQPNLDTVIGAYLGYNSPYKWEDGNVQGKPGGSSKIWGQIATEGSRAYPTQSRLQTQTQVDASCARLGVTYSKVPFQPNSATLGGRDDAILYGASVQDPGGFPLGTTEWLTFNKFYNTPGNSFTVTYHLKSGGSSIAASNGSTTGAVTLSIPSGWTVDTAAKARGATTSAAETTVDFTVTPAAGATVNTNYKISALDQVISSTTSQVTSSGYTDNVMRVVQPVEGRMHRWAEWAEYDSWLEGAGSDSRRLGRSSALESITVGTTKRITVDVHNWSGSSQSGNVVLSQTSPPTNGVFTFAGVSSGTATMPYTVAANGDTSVQFDVTSTGTAQPNYSGSNPTVPTDVTITTTYTGGAGTGNETMALAVKPKTTIPNATTAPTVDAVATAGEYTGAALDIGRRWEGGACAPIGVDCGNLAGAVAGADGTTWAKTTWKDGDLYFFAHIQDDFQGYAVSPAECVAHWLADSVEFQIDPKGTAQNDSLDTANTFKLGVFPYTNDPTGSNGNGVNGPCWERDADNHQGFSTGPLKDTVDNAPNAPGVQVASSATWVGSNDTTTAADHAYGTGVNAGYNIEVKIPVADLPAKIDPANMGLNITPYDEDNTTASGTAGALRHIDSSSRLSWSAIGGVQAAPYRWGTAVLTGFPAAPASNPTDEPNVSHPNMDGVESPQTIAQSARDGVPISGRDPAPDGSQLFVTNVKLNSGSASMDLGTLGLGKAQVFLWHGLTGYIPVFTSSCAAPTTESSLTDLAEWGFGACAATDGGFPDWTDMSGRVVRKDTVDLSRGSAHVSLNLTASQRAALAADGRLLIGYTTAAGEVQAVSLPLAEPKLAVTASVAAGDADGMDLGVRLTGLDPFPGVVTGKVQFSVDGKAEGDPVKVDSSGRAGVTTATITEIKGHTVTAEYLGDGDYAARSASLRKDGDPVPLAALHIETKCSIASNRRAVVCNLRHPGASSTDPKLTASIHLQGSSKVAKGSGKGRFAITLKSSKRLANQVKVVVSADKLGRHGSKTVPATRSSATKAWTIEIR